METTANEADSLRPWQGEEGSVAAKVRSLSGRCLDAYAANPTLIEEHANIERSTTQGGYSRRQLYELVQNGADELQREPGGHIHLVLTPTALYCANEGTPVTPEGAETILASHLSRKRGAEIGRFGLGFKSVLTVSERPQFFSRSGSFGWDAQYAQAEIRSRVPGNGPTPVLRVARVLSAETERRSDPVLDELMSWATTVVKLPLLTDHLVRLQQDMIDFPGKFLIFSPHVGGLILEDRSHPEPRLRKIAVEGIGRRRILTESDGAAIRRSEWMIFERLHRPTELARRDAGEYHNRQELPLVWAVPLSGTQAIGEFWAFFPTTYVTTLRGILNAPWKTNEDRQNLLKGNRFNDELMLACAELIVDSLPQVITAEEPATHLTLITARGREARNWADEELTRLVYQLASERPSIPDQNGILRVPRDLKLHPAKLEPSWLAQWSATPGRPEDWCHPSIEEPNRRSRAEMIFERAGRQPAHVVHWLESLAAARSVPTSGAAVRILAELKSTRHPLASDALGAKVILTADGNLVAAHETVYRRTSVNGTDLDVQYVAPGLDADLDIGTALDILGVQAADAVGLLTAALRRGLDTFGDADWERLWMLMRDLEPESACAVLVQADVVDRVCVRTMIGQFSPLSHCLVPGSVIARDSTDDLAFAIDMDFHRDDRPMLQRLGATEIPHPSCNPELEFWFDDYRSDVVKDYYASLPPAMSRPREANLVLEGRMPAGPLSLIDGLSSQASARFLASVPFDGVVRTWKVFARTRPDHAIPVPSPLVWIARRRGRLPTSLGNRAVTSCVGPSLERYARVLPVAQVDFVLADALEIPKDPDHISPELWTELLCGVESSESMDEVGELYALAARFVSAPQVIRCVVGHAWALASPEDVTVAVDRRQFDGLVLNGTPAILLADVNMAGDLVRRWSLAPIDQIVGADASSSESTVTKAEGEAITKMEQQSSHADARWSGRFDINPDADVETALTAIVRDVVRHLYAAKPDVLEITLEVTAECHHSFDALTVKTVSDNSRALGASRSRWEGV